MNGWNSASLNASRPATPTGLLLTLGFVIFFLFYFSHDAIVLLFMSGRTITLDGSISNHSIEDIFQLDKVL